jgi:TPP-dependent pyruvate/acetoin dehydrogenase alpha subunit
LIKGEVDCLEEWEKKLEARGLLSRAEMAAKREQITNELAEGAKRVRGEPQPEGSNIWDYVFADKNIVAGEE